MIHFKTIFFLILFFFANVQRSFSSEEMYQCNLAIKKPSHGTLSGSFYAKVYIEDLFEDKNSNLRFRWMTLKASENGEWSSLFKNEETFRFKIQSIELPQSIEDLGVSYLLSVCYLGEEENLNQSSKDVKIDKSIAQYSLYGTLNLGQNSDDIQYSGTIKGACDLRKSGYYKSPRLKTELQPERFENDFTLDLPLGVLPKSTIDFTQTINFDEQQVPRFCKIDFEITELTEGKRPSRQFSLQAQFFLQISRDSSP